MAHCDAYKSIYSYNNKRCTWFKAQCRRCTRYSTTIQRPDHCIETRLDRTVAGNRIFQAHLKMHPQQQKQRKGPTHCTCRVVSLQIRRHNGWKSDHGWLPSLSWMTCIVANGIFTGRIVSLEMFCILSVSSCFHYHGTVFTVTIICDNPSSPWIVYGQESIIQYTEELIRQWKKH